jgi:hypothetical protein
MVVLHPQHFLPNGAGFLVNSLQDDSLTSKVYVVAEDGALRVGKKASDQRLVCFAGPEHRAPEGVLNPLLVAINAEMAFRRFKRTPHPVCQEYSELIDLTIELVKKIYFQPVVDIAFKEIGEIRSARNIAVEAARDGDVHMGSVDEFGAKTREGEDRTITRRDARRFSRTGRVVERPDPGASHDKTIEYCQYLMSGRGTTPRFLSSFVV